MTPRQAFRALLVLAPALPAAAGASPVPVALDEVVVTARKVEEDVREVPMSVTVLGAEALADARQSHLYGLQFDVPGLLVNNIGMFGAGLSLRGVSDQVGAGAVVAAHMNGVYLGSPQLAISRLYDLERIEVLKGPQGTLYGRNSTGGSINILTRRPEEAAGAGVEAAYGNFSTGRVQGYADLPAAGTALGLAFIASEGDGYIRNSIDDRRFAEADYWAMRVSAGMRFGSAGRLDLMAQHAQDDGATGELWTPNPEYLANPRDIRLATVTLGDPYLELEDDIVTANLAYDFGRAEFVSVTGFARNGVRNRDDCAGIPDLAGCIRGDRDGRYNQWSQELQLSISGPGSVDGLVGAYYFRSDRDNQYYLYRPAPGYLNDARQTGEDMSMALFGQATIALGEHWRLTGGLRLGRDETRATTVGTGLWDSPTKLAARQDASGDAWRLDAQYAASDGMRLYASVATGYTSGGLEYDTFNGGLDAFAPEELVAYEMGIKSSSRDARLRVNAAAFYYDYRDIQVNVYESVGTLPVFGVDNAAQARLYGIDAEAVFFATEHVVLSAGMVWMPEREFTEYLDVDEDGDLLDFSGKQLVRAPELSATAAIDANFPLSGLGNLAARLEYDYRSRYYFTRDNEPGTSQDDFGLLNARVKLEPEDGDWYLFASARNLADQDYFNQVFLQSSPGLPRTWEFGAGVRF